MGFSAGQLHSNRHCGAIIPEPISSDPWQSMENQPFPTLSVNSDGSELSGIGITPGNKMARIPEETWTGICLEALIIFLPLLEELLT
jgi:hypothetical protein